MPCRVSIVFIYLLLCKYFMLHFICCVCESYVYAGIKTRKVIMAGTWRHEDSSGLQHALWIKGTQILNQQFPSTYGSFMLVTCKDTIPLLLAMHVWKSGALLLQKNHPSRTNTTDREMCMKGYSMLSYAFIRFLLKPHCILLLSLSLFPLIPVM